MYKYFLVVAALLGAVMVNAQQEVKMEELDKHVGDSVTVCTTIYRGIYLDRTNGSPTFLNAGSNYPNAPLTILIWSDTRKLFKESPEIFYKNKEVCISGKIKMYKDKPEMVVYTEDQIKINR